MKKHSIYITVLTLTLVGFLYFALPVSSAGSMQKRRGVAGSSEVEVILDDPEVDGISSYVVTYRYTTKGDQIFVGKFDMPDSHFRGFIEWDISTISDTAKIKRVSLIYSGAQDGVNSSYLGSIVQNQPSQTSSEEEEEALFNEISNPLTTYVKSWNPEIGSVYEVDLGRRAARDLQVQLEKDWFALGIGVADQNPEWNEYDGIYSEDYVSSYSNQAPALKIVYKETARLDNSF